MSSCFSNGFILSRHDFSPLFFFFFWWVPIILLCLTFAFSLSGMKEPISWLVISQGRDQGSWQLHLAFGLASLVTPSVISQNILIQCWVLKQRVTPWKSSSLVTWRTQRSSCSRPNSALGMALPGAAATPCRACPSLNQTLQVMSVPSLPVTSR